MTRQVWNFTPDEFAWVWREVGVDRYPDPISIIETATTEDEHRRLLTEISSRYPHHSDPDLTGPLRVLALPELRILCFGKALHSHKRVRSVGAASGDMGVVLFQRSGATAEFGGDIKLVVASRRTIGRHISATMPPAVPGQVGDLTGYTPRVRGEQPPSSWLRTHDGSAPVEDRIRSLLRAPRTAEGYLRIERNLHDHRPHTPTFVNWIDIRPQHPAEGRYLVTADDNETRVMAASAEVVAHQLSWYGGLTDQ